MRRVHRDGQQVDVRLVCRAAPWPDGPGGLWCCTWKSLARPGEAAQRTAFRDALTGLANRPALQVRLKRSVGGRSLLLIDLDDFNVLTMVWATQRAMRS